MRRILSLALAVLLLGHPIRARAAGNQAGGGLQTGRVFGDISFAHIGQQTVTQALASGGGGAGGISTSQAGAAGGVATLDGAKHVPFAQIPIGTMANTVADAGWVMQWVTGNAVLQTALGGAGGAAQLDANKLVPATQIPFGLGTAAKQVADAQWVQGLIAGTVPTSAVGHTVATLDGGGHVPSTQIGFGTAASAVSGVPANTATGKVADDGILAWLIGQEQSLAVTTLKVADASSGVIHVLGLNNTVEAVGRTLAARAGDVWNLADHQADGTATNDNTALANGMIYAKARGVLGTHILLPNGAWTFSIGTAAGSTNFQMEPYTSLEGMSEVGTHIYWNDLTAASYLVGSDCSSGSPADMSIRNLTFHGSWGVNGAYSGSQGPIFMTCGTNFRVQNVASYNAGGFGQVYRDMIGIQADHLTTEYSGSDGVQFEGSSNVDASNLFVAHTGDDCISAHSYPYDAFRVRRNVAIRGFTCFDSGAIDLAGARNALITSGINDSFHLSAVVLAGDSIVTSGPNAGGTGGNEGENSSGVVELSDTLMINGLNRAPPLDNTPAGLQYVIIGGPEARAGSYAGIPGEPATGSGTKTNAPNGIIDPYPELYAVNSNAASTPVAPSMTYLIHGNVFARNFPATDGSEDPRFKTFSSLGQGSIQGVNGTYDKPLPGSQQGAPAILVYSGHIRNVLVTDNMFSGVSTAFLSNGAGRLDELTFSHNGIFDALGGCVNLGGTVVTTADIEDNQCDGDPYLRAGNRGNVGNWGNDNLIGFSLKNASSAGGVIKNNKFWNVASPIDIDPTSPMSRWMVTGNIQFGHPNSVNQYDIFNVGLGTFFTAGFDTIDTDEEPGDATWHQILSVPVEASAAMPTTGFWVPGKFVRNSAPTPGSPIGWTRLTLSNTNGYTWGGTGNPLAQPTNNALGVDWAPVYGGRFTFAITGTANTATAAQCNNLLQSADASNDTLTIPSSGLFPSCRIGIVNSGSGQFTVSGATLVAGAGISSNTTNGVTSVVLAAGRAAVHILVGSDGVPTLYNGD